MPCGTQRMPPLSIRALPHMVHWPSEQAMLTPHDLPQAEQLLGSLSRFASHPFWGLPSQLANPGRH